MLIKSFFINGTGEQLYVRPGMYHNGRAAIELMRHGERYTIATVNVPDEPLAADEVIVRDYSENEGALATLLHGGIVNAPHRSVQTGFVSCPVCRLTKKARDLFAVSTVLGGLRHE